MRLTLSTERHPKNGRPCFVLRDEHGGAVPNVRTIDVHYDYAEATEITVKIIVDGKAVRMDTTDKPRVPPPSSDH